VTFPHLLSKKRRVEEVPHRHGQRNDPVCGQKQIWLRYAGIGASDGSHRMAARRYGLAIGGTYDHILKPYLLQSAFSASEAPRTSPGYFVAGDAALKSWKRKPTMIDAKMSRRGFAATAAAGLATIGLFAATVKSAEAYQGNMERALGSLQEALQSLQESTPNKGGHRERAMNLVRQAMAETQAGIQFANQHGGGGY
jgi:hypothetical protein